MDKTTDTGAKEQLRARLNDLEELIEEEDDPEARAVYKQVYESLQGEDVS